MGSVREDPFPDLKAYDYDENEFMDQSFSHICPLCHSRGLPDSLTELSAGFFLWLHLTDVEQPEACLHVMASGVHAEYLLGTKADHVLRSQAVWKKAETRLAQLLQHAKQEQSAPLTLSIRRSPDDPREFYLEHTFLVYGARHILPWF